MKFFMRLLTFAVTVVASFNAFAACKQTASTQEKKFLCSDGTIQLISLEDQHVVIKTFNPETQSWSEQRFPAIEGLSLDQVSVAIQSNG